MRTKDTLDLRPLVFLAVLMLHAAIVLLLIRPSRLSTNSRDKAEEPLIFMLLNPDAAEPAGVAKPRPAQASKAGSAQREAAPPGAITLLPEAPPPQVDWQHEADLAAQNAVAGAEREGKFRDLSSLTPQQRDWIKRNRMEPAPPGIQWRPPRVEFIDRGVPIPVIWINDRCVLIVPLVFCHIGRIEANGGLFDHMRDPRAP